MSFAGLSVIRDGRLERSAPALTGGRSSHGYHLLIVDGYSCTNGKPAGESIRCNPFMVGGYLWTIRYYPNGNRSENAEYISVYVGLYNSVALAKPVQLQAGISFVDQIEMQESRFIRAGRVCEIRSSSTRATFNQFIRREDLEKSKHLKNDSFTIRCDIIIGDTDSVDSKSPLFIEVPPSDIQQHLSDLLLSEEGTDVTFDVSGERIAAHRCVLAARSAVFKALLFGTMQEGMSTTSVIEVDDINAIVFRAMLAFIYTDMLPEMEEVEDDVMWQHLLIAADRYDLLRLRMMCEEKLCEYIDVTTVPTMLALAEQHNCCGLKERCLEFLNSPANLQTVMAIGGLDSLVTCCPSVLKDLIAKLASLKQEKKSNFFLV